jgi:hypothetical protein
LGVVRYFSQDADSVLGAHDASIGIALILAVVAAVVLIRRATLTDAVSQV